MNRKDNRKEDNLANQIDYQSLFLKSPLPTLIFDLETGKIIQADDLFCELSGYKKRQLVNLSFYDTSILLIGLFSVR